MSVKKIEVNQGRRPRLGLTTNTFMNFIKNNEITNEEILQWAYNYGFSWIEVRDPEVSIKRESLNQLKAIADDLNVRLHYAWDKNDLLHPDDSLFFSAIDKAAVFGAQTYSRVLIAPDSIKNVADKKGYTQAEFRKIVPMIERYTAYALKKGIVVCFENAFEPVQGDGCDYFGMSDLLNEAKSMKTTFDPGNFTNRMQSRMLPGAAAILEYTHKYKNRIPYFHIKTTLDYQLLSYIDNTNDFNLSALFSELSEEFNTLFCLELPPDKTLAATKSSIIQSIAYLREQKLVDLV